MSEDNLTKIVLVQEDDDGAPDVESTWAEELGGNKYKIKNFPFVFYGASYDDIVEAIPPNDEDDIRPHFVRVIEKSGHKTVRVIFKASSAESKDTEEILNVVANMGCGYEGNGDKYYVINIQPHCNFKEVCDYLSNQDIDWEHADPTYKELYPND